MLAIAPSTRDQRLWEDEVARVLATAPEMGGPARAAVLAVLDSLPSDRDVERMRAAFAGSTRLRPAA